MELMQKFEEVLHEIAKDFVRECVEDGLGNEELCLEEFILKNREQLSLSGRLREAEGIIEAFGPLDHGFASRKVGGNIIVIGKTKK